ncbi:SusD/RagB-like outer membrane lipoprotein [Lutibacter sp. Hel_I_33_5]|uniref:SusD/RagB family nutrient-binding outer membrane lipoprotein n=1 Tax=Lutibacter sp. Hel_I_33_5 TaxID=1566289 RepID=UPI0011A41136|nr:SusD/RagB family nutrient-binding outer membrane lipoprotein [Lutibacter sp. Hel_I_33_5]TVZ56979.1 SusD/RagB-like outer membrane lipoprotein [Lutibacter sp. Hel_I_33_5]
MKNIYKIFIALVVTSSMIISCETLKQEDLASPNALSADQADPDLLLNSVQLAYRNIQGTFGNIGSQLTRIDYMFGRNYFANYGSGTMNGIWTNFYSNTGAVGMVVNIAAIEALDKANPDKDLSFHVAAAKTMQAHVLMQIVDYIGKAPWSEANKPNEFPLPKFDEGQEIYTAALTMLNEAGALFASTSGAGSATDFFYGGDAAKWTKLVNTLKMRANLTTGNYTAVVNATGVITDTADDFQFTYGTNQLSPNTQHPDFTVDYTSSGAGIYQSNWLMKTMVPSFGDLRASTDPRRRYYFYRQNWRTPGGSSIFFDANDVIGNGPGLYLSGGPEDGETLSCTLENTPVHLQFTPDEDIWCSMDMGYWGRIHGNDAGTPPDNFTRTAVGVYPAGGKFDWREDAMTFPNTGGSASINGIYGQQVSQTGGGNGAGILPIYLASDVDFMKAEANLALSNPTAASTHLEAGMTKHIAKVMSFGALDGAADKSQAPNAAFVTAWVAAKKAEFDAAATNSAADGNGFPTAKDKWDLLGEQYFIAQYGSGTDTFNFYRRTGYPRTLSRNIDPNPGTFPRTLLFPGNEVSSNSNIQQRTDNSEKVFWDNGTVNPAN